MITYIIEFDDGSGTISTREYAGHVLWDVVADAEADIWNDPHIHITRVWNKGEEPPQVHRHL
jgi:hypothetical protein